MEHGTNVTSNVMPLCIGKDSFCSIWPKQQTVVLQASCDLGSWWNGALIPCPECKLAMVQEEFYRLESRLQTAYMMLLTAMGVQDHVRRYANKVE
jgi:hypothetical protein